MSKNSVVIDFIYSFINSFILSFILSVLFFQGQPLEAKENFSTKSVSVEIVLEEVSEEVANVKTYQIEVRKKSDTKSERNSEKKIIAKIFSQPDTFFKIKLNVGNYSMRTRIITKQDALGPWSEWSELLAKPEEVSLFDVPTYNIGLSKDKNSTDVDFKWQPANGANKYSVWVEDVLNKTISKKNTNTNDVKLNLKIGEYRIGVQSVSKEEMRSEIKYFENSFYVTHTQLPQIKLERVEINRFKWLKQKEADVKIEIFRKAFFGDKYIKIQTIRENGDSWPLPKNLQPGEYKIDFQYVSDSFKNGPTQSVNYLKKPTEGDFSRMAQ